MTWQIFSRFTRRVSFSETLNDMRTVVYFQANDSNDVFIVQCGFGVMDRRQERCLGSTKLIGHLHDDDIVLLRPESFRTLLSCTNQDFCYRNLTGITKLKYERKNEKDSGRNSKMTSSCKWPISDASISQHYFFTALLST